MQCIADQEGEDGTPNPHHTEINYLSPLTKEEIYTVLWRYYGIQGNLVDGSSGQEPEPEYLDPNGKVVMCQKHYELMCTTTLPQGER